MASPAFVRQFVVVVTLLEQPQTCEEVWDANSGLATLELLSIPLHNRFVFSVGILQLD